MPGTPPVEIVPNDVGKADDVLASRRDRDRRRIQVPIAEYEYAQATLWNERPGVDSDVQHAVAERFKRVHNGAKVPSLVDGQETRNILENDA